MKLMHKLNISMNKNINSSKKDLLNNNINKFVNLILTNKPISFFQKNKVNNNNSLVHKIHISGKGYSLKNLCLQNSKISLINNIKNIKKLQLQESIKSKNSMIRNKSFLLFFVVLLQLIENHSLIYIPMELLH